MAITGAQLVEDAMYQCGALGQGDNLGNDDAQLVLRRLNRMLDSWANQKLLIYTVGQETFPMTSGVSTYTSAALAGGRPVAVDSIFVRLGTIDYTVDIVDSVTYDSIPIKSITGIPAVCYVDNSFPVMTFSFYPTPYSAFTCYMSSRRVLSTPITMATSLSLPPGYERAIVDGCGVDIAPSFGKPVTQDMRESARESIKVLKVNNFTAGLMKTGFEPSSDDLAYIYKLW